MRALALAGSKPDHPRRARQAAISQLGTIAGEDPDEARRGEIRRALVQLLDDPHARVRGTAAGGQPVSHNPNCCKRRYNALRLTPSCSAALRTSPP